MAESPTRRSSIPILKQTNKTKSFQSYVNLNLTDDQSQQRKSRSPSSSSMSPPILEVQKLQTKPPQARPMNHAPKLEIDNDIIITKLCDENKRLKDHQTQLVSKYEEALRENMEIQNKNDQLQKELIGARREVAEKIYLQKTIENLQKHQLDVVEKNKKLQKKLEEILPESIKDYEVTSFETPLNKLENSHMNSDLHNIMGELEKLKSYLNNVELQLYEANERISDLLETKQELEDENKNLKTHNAELSNLTKLMTTNMNETLSTSKKMEETFLRVKTERDELIRQKNRDTIDGKAVTVNSDEIASLKTELKRQKAHYEAQFIEYKNTQQLDMQEQIDIEVETLKIQISLLETELEISKRQAENAEEELRQLKATLRMSASKISAMDAGTSADINEISYIPLPPPPPPPMPLLNSTQNNNTFRSRSNSQTLSDAISDAQQKLQQSSKEPKKATGIDAVIDDLKNGRVTLRRRPRPNLPSPTQDFTSVYQLLQKTQKANRSSKKIIDNELSTVFRKFKLDI